MIEKADLTDNAISQIVEAVKPFLEEKDKEIERLNNIINELENYIIENSFGSPVNNCSVIETYKILNKLQKLKGSNKNEYDKF